MFQLHVPVPVMERMLVNNIDLEAAVFYNSDSSERKISFDRIPL
jgi:hypothetical protein